MIGQVVMLMMVNSLPSYQVTGKMQKPNSVNPKLIEHGNTELNSTKVDKGVETKGFPAILVDDIVRATVKTVELSRNDLVDINEYRNRLRRNRHDIISGGSWYRYLAVREYHWMEHN